MKQIVTMAGLDPATQPRRVNVANKASFGAQTRAYWVAASRAAMVNWF
jgi:hypothetical protein